MVKPRPRLLEGRTSTKDDRGFQAEHGEFDRVRQLTIGKSFIGAVEAQPALQGLGIDTQAFTGRHFCAAQLL